MQTSIDKIHFLYRGKYGFEEMKELPALPIFDEDVCCFLSEYSKLILKDKEAKLYPDIITFAFFCRKSNLEKLKKEYRQGARFGKGFTFHIAPSNVPINFAYTLAAGLLAGNTCVIRVSSKNFQQTEILCRILQQMYERFENPVKNYIGIITFERKKEVMDYMSGLCDVRVIWGGDETISRIRESKLQARSTDITFGDRYSICMIRAEEILKIREMEKLAQEFYNDTFLNDQNACSSPKSILWVGNDSDIEKAQSKFWDAIHEYTENKYHLEPMTVIDKYLTGLCCAIDMEGVRIKKHKNNLIWRIEIPEPNKKMQDYICMGGCFLEYKSENLDILEKVVTKKYQTVSYYGFEKEELQEWIREKRFSGIDRIVPIGKTLEFSLIWDGYDLIRELSRMYVII
ncbi:MAG: acyl-CoA reductase [Lachnospiraceae bacterium]|nr:acyl-CoA reductase [Lachnospiraceae bacterium]